MRENRDLAIDFVLEWEGGYVEDTGGPTKFGISQKAHPDIDVVNLSREEAIKIYIEHYWEPLGCDDLPYPLDIVHFDTGVNLGHRRAMVILSEVRKMPDVEIAWREYLLRRLQRYSFLARQDKYKKYLRGWLNRVLALWEKIQRLGQ